MKMSKFVAVSALLVCSTTCFSHQPKPQAQTAVIKEQKDWGIAGDAKSAQRTVKVRMSDQMRFTPAQLTVTQGETVRLIIQNKGKLMHELVIGAPQDLEARAALMLKFPDMAHDEPYMAHVPPGGSGQLVWTFNHPVEIMFACLIAGHYQADMNGRIIVLPTP